MCSFAPLWLKYNNQFQDKGSSSKDGCFPQVLWFPSPDTATDTHACDNVIKV